MQENLALTEVKVEIKGKSIPFGFSTYPLYSQYQIYLTKENVDLWFISLMYISKIFK